ncbi:DUF2474 domain-containing protein [Aureimonas leprariae]|uniref:DUF2474 domain-containing protein n=1 Tax=Plantimonas leprariae TaxID=2615207 RepID=A0A7V7TW86_9HYPH|nr:DUF2474 domain-containing protein [Aureimonas leprariae]KAB0679738.1 DUF2474 domain-containing protein [Aureimonas leprariae]
MPALPLWARQLGWMLLLWLLGLGVVGTLAFIIRLWLHA